MPETITSLIEKLEGAVAPDLNSGCWLWTGSAYEQKGRLRGYVTIDGKSELASRAAFRAFSGVDPGSGYVCHKCDVSLCINPNHLYLGDHASNMADMVQRKRSFGATQPERCREAGRKGGLANTWHRGEGNPKAKLTAEDADLIRADPRKTAALAELYGVNRTTIQRIRRGDLWPVLRAQSEARV
ncbi:MAG: hypothetical protein WC563_10385 [Brevundimonas sp.]